MRTLRNLVLSHGECGWLLDQAERLCRGLFDLKDGRVMIPFFTDHGPDHSKRVEAILDQIVFPAEFNPDDPRTFLPTPEEAMYLLAAAWVHDIGMIYGLFPGGDAGRAGSLGAVPRRSRAAVCKVHPHWVEDRVSLE